MSVKKYYSLSKKRLFKINRSITGEGIRRTLNIIKKEHPSLKIKSIKSGTKVFDWTIPSEWNVSSAYVIDKKGKKIIDFKNNNLHLVGYSEPIKKKINKIELLKRLYSIKSKPNAIPYITSYYKKNWGFCITHEEKKNFNRNYKKKDIFKVVINSNFKKKGTLNYGELIIQGKSKKEILISTYVCHPSMANNELSGPIVSMSLIQFYKKKIPEKTLKFLFIPETIGSISFLFKNQSKLKNILAGYNLSCIGDERKHSCMFSKYKNTISDRSLAEAYKLLKINYKEYSFLNRGSDERQYCSPGIDLPIASIFRSKYGEYKEYHTSLDDFKVVTLKGLKGGYDVAKKSIDIIQKKIVPENKILCVPFMSKRSLYPLTSNAFQKNSKTLLSRKIMDFLQFCDGKNELEYISKLVNINKKLTKKIYLICKKNNLIK